ncbi:hypothetical protein Hanom_Chr12g01066721 [Helianthus anomalus]
MEQCHNEIEVGWVASPLPNSPSTFFKVIVHPFTNPRSFSFQIKDRVRFLVQAWG